MVNQVFNLGMQVSVKLVWRRTTHYLRHLEPLFVHCAVLSMYPVGLPCVRSRLLRVIEKWSFYILFFFKSNLSSVKLSSSSGSPLNNTLSERVTCIRRDSVKCGCGRRTDKKKRKELKKKMI